jgi:hypothetical protein
VSVKKEKKTPVPPQERNPAGRPFTAVRWSIHQASLEFGISKNELSERLKAAGLMPGADNKFSTAQICEAKFGSAERERARKLREDADGSAIANMKSRGELVPKDRVIKFCAGIAIEIRQNIIGSTMSDEEKDQLLEALRQLCDEGVVTRSLGTS